MMLTYVQGNKQIAYSFIDLKFVVDISGPGKLSERAGISIFLRNHQSSERSRKEKDQRCAIMNSLRDQLNRSRDRFNDVINPNAASNDTLSWRDEMGNDFQAGCSSLSYENRLYGFGGCLLIAAALSCCSIILISFVKIVPFAIFYSIGSILGLLSTMFLGTFLPSIRLISNHNIDTR